jgi:dienelactone hydrolase
VAAVDHRDYGESERVPAPARSAARENLGLDLLGAIAAAGSRAGADTSRVAAIGTGISAPAAVRCARENAAVRALVLFVGALGSDEEEYLMERLDLPLLMVAAKGDARGTSLMHGYARRFAGPDQVYVEMDAAPGERGDWRGTDGLTGDTGLAGLLIWFLERHLPVEPAGR